MLNDLSKIVGLKRGVVKDLKDPEKLNRVKVELIDEGIELDYAPVIATFANKESGTVIIPSVGDEVLVGFVGGQINSPVILGSIYNSINKPMTKIDNENDIMAIHFPAGLNIEILNKKENQKVTLTTKNKHTIILDDKSESAVIKGSGGKTCFDINFQKGTISLKAEKTISLAAGKSTVEIDATKGFNLKSASSGNFSANAKNVTLSAQANAKITASGQGTLKASGKMDVQGAVTNVKSSGITSVKGAMVKIN